MIDVSTLQGSSVRDASGARGEILTLDPCNMVVGWWDEGATGIREEEIFGDRFEQLEVLTLSTGWVPVAEFIEVIEDVKGPRGLTLSEDLNNLLDEGGNKGGGSPFVRASKTGPATGSRVLHKRDYWKCTTGTHDGYKQRKGGDKYFYKCTGKEGEKKTISRSKKKKAAYQQLYKAWWSSRQDVAAPNTRLKKKIARKAKAKAKKG